MSCTTCFQSTTSLLFWIKGIRAIMQLVENARNLAGYVLCSLFIFFSWWDEEYSNWINMSHSKGCLEDRHNALNIWDLIECQAVGEEWVNKSQVAQHCRRATVWPQWHVIWHGTNFFTPTTSWCCQRHLQLEPAMTTTSKNQDRV